MLRCDWKMPFIYLIDINGRMVKAWDKCFGKEAMSMQIEFSEFMDLHSDVDAVVSPANSFGLMDGGYDAAITEYFGTGLQESVRRRILEEFLGEQPVASSLVVEIPGFPGKILIHVPSMRMPERIADAGVVYQCMRSALLCAVKHEVKQIVIPAFGGLTGGVPEEIVSDQMYRAYLQIKGQLRNPHMETWETLIK